jgi:hypothetical protein
MERNSGRERTVRTILIPRRPARYWRPTKPPANRFFTRGSDSLARAAYYAQSRRADLNHRRDGFRFSEAADIAGKLRTNRGLIFF